MSSTIRLVILAAFHALAWGEEHSCKCVVEVPPTPEPNRAVLELLEKQLDRCGPEHQTCPACPKCPPLPAVADAAHGNFSNAACAMSMLLGIVLGRFSYFLVPFIGKSGKHSSSMGIDEREAQLDHHEQKTEAVKYADDGRGDLPEESEPMFSAYTSRSDVDFGSDSRVPSVAEEGKSNNCRFEDDLEDEEKLGIIDAGDEEWLEVCDVIREHSAVTIFNHTDSTWYVSSKHPQFVRPLHGKRRHPLRHSQVKQTWTHNPEEGPSHQEVSEMALRQLHPHIEASPYHARGHSASIVEGDHFAGKASSHIRRIQQRPHSAPSPAYSRADGQPSTSGRRQNPAWRCNDSHQRCASADPAQLAQVQHIISENEGTDASRTLIQDNVNQDIAGGYSGSGGKSMSQSRSASPPILEDPASPRSYED